MSSVSFSSPAKVIHTSWPIPSWKRQLHNHHESNYYRRYHNKDDNHQHKNFELSSKRHITTGPNTSTGAPSGVLHHADKVAPCLRISCLTCRLCTTGGVAATITRIRTLASATQLSGFHYAQY